METPSDKQRALKKLGIDPARLERAVEQATSDYQAYVKQPQQASPELRLSIQQVREDYTSARPLQVQIDSIRPERSPRDDRQHYALDMSIDAEEVVSTPRVGQLFINDVPLEVSSVRHDVARGRNGMRWRLRIDAAVSGNQGVQFDTQRDQRVSGTLEGGRPFDGCYRSDWSRLAQNVKFGG